MQRNGLCLVLLGLVVCLFVAGYLYAGQLDPSACGPGRPPVEVDAAGPAFTWDESGGFTGIRPAYAQGYESYWDMLYLLARVIEGEAADEPFIGKVAVGAVILNRVRDARFPKTVAGVIFQPWAFESVSNGQMWRGLSNESIRAAQAALAGWDPTYGALFFWNPAKTVSPWIWTRSIITWIGRHVFAR
ncbi:MAG: cell wall hydrolase [Desulfotomaculales bacterium]